MHVAIDKDGTFTAHPKEFVELIIALRAAGHNVTILTGSVPGVNDAGILAIRQQLGSLGLSKELYGLIVCTGANVHEVAEGKGRWCAENKIAMLFEDSPLYLHRVRQFSPATVCFQILPIGGP